MTAEIHYLKIKPDTPEQTAYFWDKKLQLEQQYETIGRELEDVNRILGILAVEKGLEG